MLKLALFSFSFTLLLFCTPAIAQETDPYGDYSYLWPNKDKKKKKSKKKVENPPAPVLTVASDTIPPLDSLQTDSLSTEDVLPTDTTDNYYDDPFGEGVAREPKEKKEAQPIQDFRTPLSSEVGSGSFVGGFTFTRINGENFAGLVLSPEFSIGKVGVGLNVPILYGLESQKVRTEIFQDGVGAARLIRYIRYGQQKVDPVYIKVGEIDGLMLGYGGLINNYTNTISFEKRKVGLHTDFNYEGVVGIEAMYSDFDPASQNLLAIRPYVRPLSKTPIPVARTLEFGATFVSDKDQTDIPLTDSTTSKYIFTAEGINAFGLDMGITVFRSPFVQIDLFANYSRLNVLSDTLRSVAAFLGETNLQKGSGSSFGANFRMHFIADIFSTDVRIERLSYTENYLPQFFDATYELEKDARIFNVVSAAKTNGIYGSLTGHVLQKVQLGGSLLIPDDVSETAPALVRVHADLERLLDKYSLHASYTKTNLNELKDVFSFDERSLAKISFIYHMNRFLATGVEYYYFWEPGPTGDLEVNRYIMPYFGLSIDF
ncbi:MAG: hypothetical protein AAF551_10840 [Bacteroidota bacterium]